MMSRDLAADPLCWVFKNFFFAGFEGTTGYNKHHQWIDQVSLTQHDVFLREDYCRLRNLGIRAVRESIRWPLVDSNGCYDFSTLKPFLEAAAEYEMEVLYDLFHFGYPEGVDLFSPDFPPRFADYCQAAARYVAEHSAGAFHFAPLNEPSFFAWAAGEVGLFAPHLTERGAELKIRLIDAAIQGINAIWSVCPRVNIVNIDPICRVAAPAGDTLLERHAEDFNSTAVFQAWDMLSGRLHPELGGSPAHLGTIGVNYYWTNQWEWGNPCVPLADSDERRWPLHRLLGLIWNRYGHQLLLTETGHIGEMRANWLCEMANEVELALAGGIPLEGVCLYPILGMQEWHSPGQWPAMGMWDLVRNGSVLERVPFAPMIDAFTEARRLERKLNETSLSTAPNSQSSVAGIR